MFDDDGFDVGVFDYVCDARASSEYEDDYVLGVISILVFDDEERKCVGIIYK